MQEEIKRAEACLHC